MTSAPPRGRSARLSVIAGIALLLAVASVGKPGQADGDCAAIKPFDVIDRAIVRWQARPRPTMISYTVDFTGSHSAKKYRRRFRVDYAVGSHDTRITTLSSEGPAPPFIQPEKQRLLPIETFGFVPRDTSLASVSPAPSSTATALPVIAAVRALSRYPYDVNLLGVEQVGDQRAYHLALEPRQNPDAYPLRELWIDAATYDVLKVTALQFEQLGPLRVPYRVSALYAEEGPYWIIHRAQAGASIHAGFFSYASSAEAVFEDFQYVP